MTAKRIRRVRAPVQLSLVETDPLAYRRSMDTQELIRHLSVGSDADAYAANMLEAAFDRGYEVCSEENEDENTASDEEHEESLSDIHSALLVANQLHEDKAMTFREYKKRVEDITKVVELMTQDDHTFREAAAKLKVEIALA